MSLSCLYRSLEKSLSRRGELKDRKPAYHTIWFCIQDEIHNLLSGASWAQRQTSLAWLNAVNGDVDHGTPSVKL